jgi:hypothetical protein
MSEVWKMADSETYTVRIKGVRPLLMHAPTGLGDKPRLRRGEHLDPKVEAESYLYKDTEGRICIPAVNIKAAMIRAARFGWARCG